MAACPLPITVVYLTNRALPVGRTSTAGGSGASASVSYLVSEWPVELDMRRELAPFGLVEEDINGHDVCGMIPLTIEGASSALYTQNSGVIFIHSTPGTVFFFKRRLRSPRSPSSCV